MKTAAGALGLAAVLLCQSALADGMSTRRYRSHYYRYVLPPERHVVEVVRPPWSGNFIINGRPFTGVTPACFRWAAGEPIRLLAGDWHGRCAEATFYNLLRRDTCTVLCG
jgi:hypothetical protein